jgi:hypothetical protein
MHAICGESVIRIPFFFFMFLLYFIRIVQLLGHAYWAWVKISHFYAEILVWISLLCQEELRGLQYELTLSAQGLKEFKYS